MARHIPRLYLNCPLALGEKIALTPDHYHHLTHVLKCGPESLVKVFNGLHGEWLATYYPQKKTAFLTLTQFLRKQISLPSLWLVFCPLKKDALRFLIEKTTELGVTKFMPVQTHYTDSKYYTQEKAQHYAIGAAEQSERLCLPEFSPLSSLETLLAMWPQEQPLYAAIERAEHPFLLTSLPNKAPRQHPLCLFVGPEGGISPAEQTLLLSQPFIRPTTLGPLILKAETAAIFSVGLAYTKLCGT